MCKHARHIDMSYELYPDSFTKQNTKKLFNLQIRVLLNMLIKLFGFQRVFWEFYAVAHALRNEISIYFMSILKPFFNYGDKS